MALKFLILAMLAALTLVVAPAALKQAAPDAEQATPDVTRHPPLLWGQGIESAVLAQAEIDIVPDISGFVLDRLVLPNGVELPQQTPGNPELVFVEQGAVTYEDRFGFTIRAGAGEPLFLQGGLPYRLRNSASGPTTLNRLGLSPNAGDEPTAENASDTGSGEALASPVPTVRERLINRPMPDQYPGFDATMFLARMTLLPNGGTSVQVHDGPLGLYVERGALSVMTPSGTPGHLAKGEDAVLPGEGTAGGVERGGYRRHRARRGAGAHPRCPL